MTVDEDPLHSWSDENYPRPLLFRSAWAPLNGPWEFAADPDNCGLEQAWFAADCEAFAEVIQVPFPPGSPSSGVWGDQPEQVPEVVWYRKTLTAEKLRQLTESDRVRLNFEAVDYRADVWVNGQHLITHEGGYTPFSAEWPRLTQQAVEVVVRCEDSRSPSQPRGKQAWRDQVDSIWYHRSTGIWRDVWIEAVPTHTVENFQWETDLVRGALRGKVGFNRLVPSGSTLELRLRRGPEVVASLTQAVSGLFAQVQFDLPMLRNRMDWTDWVWSPEHPHLLDLDLTLTTTSGQDRVLSYVGLRTVEAGAQYLHLNRLPVYLRGVLDQGYWPDTYFTAPSPTALKRDAELALELGFNLARIHERSADRRYLTWADRLGLMVWAEFPSTYAFDEDAVRAVTAEWTELVLRDRAHPCIVTWVPFNESWGVPEIASDPRQSAFVSAVVSLTRALDQTRPVSANDGWEQLETDLVTTHDYGAFGSELRANYHSQEAVARSVGGVGPQGRLTLLNQDWAGDRPVLVSEFGGVSLSEKAGWGYSVATNPAELADRLDQLFSALWDSPVLAGFCYTQLTDTAQEANGLCWPNRQPKVPLDQLHAIIYQPQRHRDQIRPRLITEETRPGGES